MKTNIFPHMKPCRITDVSNELTAGKHLRNRIITVVEDRTEDWGSNEFNEINSLDNSAVNQEVESDRTIMSGCEGKYFDSTVTTDVSLCQLGSCKTMINVIATITTDIVTMIETANFKLQAECSNIRWDFITIAESLDSKLPAVTENITAKIQQENEKPSEKVTQKLHNETFQWYLYVTRL
jgi:hypothetical protein